MLMLYFSGTGNSRYIAELFCGQTDAACHSIEEKIDFKVLIDAEDVIGFCYPVYFSSVPKMMRAFAAEHMEALKGKQVIIFCTQFMLSGYGSRKFVFLFPKGHVDVIYTAHFFMPNNMPDVPVLPISSDKGIEKSLARAEKKMETVCRNIRDGKVKKRGFSPAAHLLGLLQSTSMGAMERRANRAVSIDSDCTKCGLCLTICPMDNFSMDAQGVRHNHNCTMCYRCINVCPEKSISVLLSGKIKRQYQGIPSLRGGSHG
ncbi:MAG: EFR1 family ferrodoxin [Oscillospiraceae bacterium]|nr:EFR1 family ferrodoxin [Oscillospiraceae bacterium]